MPVFLQTASLAGNRDAAISADNSPLVCRLLLVLLFMFLLFLLILSAFLSFLFLKAALGVWAVSLRPLRLPQGIIAVSTSGHVCMAVRIAARKKGRDRTRQKACCPRLPVDPVHSCHMRHPCRFMIASGLCTDSVRNKKASSPPPKGQSGTTGTWIQT